jgi:hypothetical protein
MKNLTEVSNDFLSLIQVSSIIQNKTKVLNLKTFKTQVSVRYLILAIILINNLHL